MYWVLGLEEGCVLSSMMNFEGCCCGRSGIKWLLCGKWKNFIWVEIVWVGLLSIFDVGFLWGGVGGFIFFLIFVGGFCCCCCFVMLLVVWLYFVRKFGSFEFCDDFLGVKVVFNFLERECVDGRLVFVVMWLWFDLLMLV